MSLKWFERTAEQKLLLKLLAYRRSPTSAVAPWEPYCDAPVRVVRSHRPSEGQIGPEVVMYCPCRVCAKCLQFRQMKWRERALRELHECAAGGGRSWWTTLTFSETHLAGIRMEALKRRLPVVRSTGDPAVDAKRASDARVEAAAYRHLQLYFKRLRKSGARFRYFAAFELGEKTGRGHYHVMFHETTAPLSSRLLEQEWRSHSQPRLVRGEVAGLASYLTKYLTKSLGIRPRASVRYGGPKSGTYHITITKLPVRKDAEHSSLKGGNKDAPQTSGGPGAEPPPVV